MKTINLFLKAHFTSLSPDGQFISLAIVSDDSAYDKPVIKNDSIEEFVDHIKEKSFYCEFSDFDINRCDDWVKENVISKLNINFKYTDPREDVDCMSTLGYNWKVKGKDSGIKVELSRWLSQFSDYKLNFIVDCGWFCWGKFVELMGEWEEKPDGILDQMEYGRVFKVGLPKLPDNFPPVPQDLNDLIALRRGISVSEAFELDRESLAYDKEKWNIDYAYMDKYSGSKTKFNALFDAKATKAIYEKLS